MTKLEQLSELLVSEIGQLEKSVDKLERIQQQKIGFDSEAFEKVLLQHQEKIAKEFASISIEMQDLKSKLQGAKAYPVWTFAVFVVSIILNGILITVFLF